MQIPIPSLNVQYTVYRPIPQLCFIADTDKRIKSHILMQKKKKLFIVTVKSQILEH